MLISHTEYLNRWIYSQWNVKVGENTDDTDLTGGHGF